MLKIDLPRLSNADFEKLSHLIFTDYGIKMPISKKVMLEGRLRKRLKANNLESYDQYCDLVFSKLGMEKEVIHMIDVVSTNKTDFFRESAHFSYMNDVLLPEYLEKNSENTLNIWSSASSSGEEPYSIAITIEEFLKNRKLFDYSIHCTDISTEVLKKGVQGIYDEGRIVNIPLNLKKKYFLKGKDENSKLVRVVPSLREKLTFNRLNLMDPSYSTPNDFDIIFCRNVLIYFDKETQEQVINKLCKRLKPGGIFFLGHSESITGISVPLQTIKPTIFRKK